MSVETLIKYPLIFVVGASVATLVTWLWRLVAPKLGFIDKPGGRKKHKAPIAVAGGVGVFVGFHAACAAIFLLPWQPFAGAVEITWWLHYAPLSFGVLALGLLDDRFGTKPLVKLGAQVLLASGAYFLNIRLQNVLGFDLPAWVDFCGTILWFIAIMNSFNLIDGIDGLSAGIALIASLGVGISLIFRGQPGDVLLFLGFAGACLGFLRFNFYPATIFLGDTGSLFIGFTLAALTISTSSKGPAVAAIGMPMLAVGIPLFDSALAVWRRSMRRVLKGTSIEGERVSIDQADADHLHHRLLGQGRRHDQVAWLLYAGTALLATVGIVATIFNDKAVGILAVAFVITAYVVVRHLSWIELCDTGEVILRGISRPVHRNLSLLLYLASDLILLNVAWLIGGHLLHRLSGGAINLKSEWLHAFWIDILIPFIVLICFRSYSRVWSLASILEYVGLLVAGVISGILCVSVHLITQPVGLSACSDIIRVIIMLGLAVPTMLFSRAVMRSVQGLMGRFGHRAKHSSEVTRMLVVGCGSNVVLYLRRRALMGEHTATTRVIGLVSDDPSLCGCLIDGYRVFGLTQDLPRLVEMHKIQSVHRAGDMNEVELKELQVALKGTGVRCTHSKITVQDIQVDE